eukprot:234488-Pyramimonas_sp.AAC.2
MLQRDCGHVTAGTQARGQHATPARGAEKSNRPPAMPSGAHPGGCVLFERLCALLGSLWPPSRARVCMRRESEVQRVPGIFPRPPLPSNVEGV